MILGLDISTTCTGWALMDTEDNIVDSGYIKLKEKSTEKSSLFIRLDRLIERLEELLPQASEVCIEEPLSRFKAGASQAKTIIMLNSFNSMVQYYLWKKNIPFTVTPASTIRKSNGFKKEKGADIKKSVLDFVLDKFPEHSVEYTSYGNIRQECYDEADAILVARAGICMKKKN